METTVDSKPDGALQSEENVDAQDNRRELVGRLGRFAVYAAPFTVLALAQRADAGSSKSDVLHR